MDGGNERIVDTTPHAIKRAKERYGVEISEAQWTVLRQQLKHRLKAAIYIGAARHDGEKWLVKVGERVLVAIYKRAEHTIVTIVPPEGNVLSKPKADRLNKPRKAGKQHHTGHGRKLRTMKTGRPRADLSIYDEDD